MSRSTLAVSGESGSFRLARAVACAPVLVALWIPVAPGMGQGAGTSDPSRTGQREPFAWKATYDEALVAARERSRPVLLYFPPVRDSDEPALVARLPKLFGVPPTVEGVRVGADEILELMERFRVKSVPALVLTDLRENVLSGWQDGLAVQYLSTLKRAIRQFYKREARDAASIRDAGKLARRGDLDAAYRRVAMLLASKHTSPRHLVAARRIEASVLEEFWRRFYRVLARERLVPDSAFRAALKDLRSRLSHPRFQGTVDRELLRLKTVENRE